MRAPELTDGLPYDVPGELATGPIDLTAHPPMRGNEKLYPAQIVVEGQPTAAAGELRTVREAERERRDQGMTEEDAHAAIDEVLRGSGVWSDVHREGSRSDRAVRVVALDGECTAAQLRAIADILDRMEPPPDPYRFSASFEVGGDDMPIAGTARDIVEKP
jgi:hypothetical protein